MTLPDPLGGLGGQDPPGGAGPGLRGERPSEAGPGADEPRSPGTAGAWVRTWLATPATTALLLALAAAFGIQLWAGGSRGDDPLTLFRLGALHWPAVWSGDLWRLGSYAFLHVGWAHFLLNAWALWMLMRPIEQLYGSVGSLGLFAVAALAGGAASAAWTHAGGGLGGVTAGASGGIFGLFGARLGLLLRLRHLLPRDALRAEVRNLLVNLGLNALLAFQAATGGLPLDNAAHLGGFLIGAFFSLGAPIVRLRSHLGHRAVGGLLLAATFALAAAEGAAAARAIRPHTRQLVGDGLIAEVPWMLVPVAPGEAIAPGGIGLYARVTREREPIEHETGEERVELGGRSWTRGQVAGPTAGHGWVDWTSDEPPGRLQISIECEGVACRTLAEPAARTVAASLRLTR